MAPMPAETGYGFGAPALGLAMPMYLCLNSRGIIDSCGPTLAKIAQQPLQGLRLQDAFDLRRPGGIADIAGLRRHYGQRLRLVLRALPEVSLRGVALPMTCGGTLVNLSFGIDLPNAVRRHALSDSDFAPTDLAIELLSLIEVMQLVRAELLDLNQRMRGAKIRAEEEAQSDTLTGLRNRRAMNARLDSLVHSGAPFGLMHLDLDFFKQVNDRFGHAAGDHVLQQVATALTRATRKQDTVARVGGDEFVILLPGMVDMPRLDRVALRILESIARPILYEGNPCRISASIGTTLSTLYAMPEAEEMLADADRALYASKRSGRSRATVHSAED